jgi:nucleolar complex protein 3
MCTLLAEATHFNFNTNLISCIIARLSRKSWDKVRPLVSTIVHGSYVFIFRCEIDQSSELCIKTIIKVFRNDLAGHPSLEIVRMLNRMVKERNFAIHPNVLSCLLHLRLRTELGVRASDTKVEKEGSMGQNQRLQKGKKAKQLHLSKKTRKVLKEKKEIEQEMLEAAAEIDREERAAIVSFLLSRLWSCLFVFVVPKIHSAVLLILLMTAYRDAKASFCAVLQGVEEPPTESTPVGHVDGSCEVCTPC